MQSLRYNWSGTTSVPHILFLRVLRLGDNRRWLIWPLNKLWPIGAVRNLLVIEHHRLNVDWALVWVVLNLNLLFLRHYIDRRLPLKLEIGSISHPYIGKVWIVFGRLLLILEQIYIFKVRKLTVEELIWTNHGRSLLNLLWWVVVMTIGLVIYESSLNIRGYACIILLENVRFIRGWATQVWHLVLIRSINMIISWTWI